MFVASWMAVSGTFDWKTFPSKMFRLGTRLAQSVEHETLNLRVVGSRPTLVSRFG